MGRATSWFMDQPSTLSHTSQVQNFLSTHYVPGRSQLLTDEQSISEDSCSRQSPSLPGKTDRWILTVTQGNKDPRKGVQLSVVKAQLCRLMPCRVLKQWARWLPLGTEHPAWVFHVQLPQCPGGLPICAAHSTPPRSGHCSAHSLGSLGGPLACWESFLHLVFFLSSSVLELPLCSRFFLPLLIHMSPHCGLPTKKSLLFS